MFPSKVLIKSKPGLITQSPNKIHNASIFQTKTLLNLLKKQPIDFSQEISRKNHN
jgi:hypothetical protein